MKEKQTKKTQRTSKIIQKVTLRLMDTKELKDRWVQLLRMKAAEYEHTARKNGEVVASPSIDTICNEMEAFFTGLNK